MAFVRFKSVLNTPALLHVGFNNQYSGHRCYVCEIGLKRSTGAGFLRIR